MKILEVKINYDDKGTISRIVVLSDYSSEGDNSDIRAIVATNRPQGGYIYMTPGEKIHDGLIRQVADYGMEVSADTEFPEWKKRYR